MTHISLARDANLLISYIRGTYNLPRMPVLNTPVLKDPEHFVSHHSRM